MTSLRPDILSLVESFNNDPEVNFELSIFYQLFPEELDSAIEISSKALELDAQNVSYALNLSNLHYRKFSIYSDKSDLYNAIEIAKNAMDFPDAQETTGPRNIVNRRNQLSLYFFLAGCYIEQLLTPLEEVSGSEREELLKNAEDAVHQIEQIFGSGEDPQVIRWVGMLELAKGEKNSAVRKLYGAYTQLRTSGIETSTPSYLRSSYSQLAYTLANYFKETPEKGAVFRFLGTALVTGIVINKPYALLDYAEQAIEFNQVTNAISQLDLYEENYGANERSRQLRIRAFIKGNQFEEAENLLAAVDLSEKEKNQLYFSLLMTRIRQLQLILNQKKLQEDIQNSGIIQEKVDESSILFLSSNINNEETADKDSDDFVSTEIKRYREEFSDLLEKYINLYPESLDQSTFIFACRNYILLNRIESAKSLVDTFLFHNPDSMSALFYKEYLLEPEPQNINSARRLQIQERILLNITDLAERHLNLGGFYLAQNEIEKSVEEFNKVLLVENWVNKEGLFERPDFVDFERTSIQLQVATNQLFGLAIEGKNWELARKIANIARIENFDECEGQYFYARLEVALSNYEEALNYIDNALSLRPIFSYGYMLRSTIHGALGNNVASIEDAREAVSLNPRNPEHLKRLALVLYKRDQRLGDSVTSEQRIETRIAFDTAVALNSSDLQLLSFYAEYISLNENEQARALAIRQYLYKNNINMANALLLGSMAMKIAISETDETQKKALFDISGQALAEAYKLDPTDRSVLDTYAQYYRTIGEDEKSWALLEKSEDKRLLWDNYYRRGKYEEAKMVLQQVYAKDPTDSNSLLGLVMISKETGDIKGVKDYSEQLVSLEGNVQDYLIQIQTFLEVGLVSEAEFKLQSFMERYPGETQALLLQAWLMMRQGRLTGALQAVNRYLETNEENAIAWEVRGRIYYLMTAYNQAIEDFNRSRVLFDAPQLSIYLSKAYIKAQKNQEAITELQSAIENPQISNTARLLLEDTYKKLNRKDALRRFYDETIRDLPGNALWYIKAASFAQEQGDFSRASRLYGRALQLNAEKGQGSLTALDGYLNSLISDGKYSQVFEVVPNYVNGKFASMALFRMAEAKLKSGDRISAIEYCQKAVDESNPDIIRFTRIVARIISLLGKEFLYKYCQEQIVLNPESEKINFIMYYLMLEDNEQYNKAIEYINKCIQTADSKNQESIIYILEKAKVLNLAYEKTSDKVYLDGAIKEHKSLLQKMPNNTGVLNNLAYLLAESDEALVEALEYARKAYEKQPNNPNILDTYAYVLYKNEQYEQAAELAQASLQHFEDNQSNSTAQAYEHLGMIQEKLGLKKEAVNAYQQALSIGGLSEKSVDRINSAINKMSQDSL
ncbi:MAG: tetratricopeptide repeat protein [Planctomycetota bacterium]|jgi:tetratricopeptide (TPR) repeat protein